MPASLAQKTVIDDHFLIGQPPAIGQAPVQTVFFWSASSSLLLLGFVFPAMMRAMGLKLTATRTISKSCNLSRDVLGHRGERGAEKIRLLAGVPKAVAFVEVDRR